MSAQRADLEPGDVVAGYRVDAVLGRGGMGVVYRAWQSDLERVVALKVIATAMADDPGFRARFRREALTAAAIEHPNVVPVYQAGEWEGRPFIAMRLVDGTDLAAVLAAGPLDRGRAIATIASVAAALDAAHSRGLIHRDVKPANVLIEHPGGDEHAYLTDFGLALAGSAASEERLTTKGAFVGTVDYIAPEQLRGERCDLRADIYSLGCMAFQLLSGDVPFPRDSQIATIYAHLNEPPPAAGVSPTVDEAIRRAMAKDPGDRFGSAGEFARALTSAQRDDAPTAPSASALPPPPPRAPSTEVSAPRPHGRFRTRVVAHAAVYAPLFAAGYVLGRAVT